MKNYSIIIDEEKKVKVIPSKWLSADKKTMFWPPFLKKSDVTDAIVKLKDIADDWKKYYITSYVKSNDSYVDAVSESKIRSLQDLTDASDEEKIKKSRSSRHRKVMEPCNNRKPGEPPQKIIKINNTQSESENDLSDNEPENKENEHLGKIDECDIVPIHLNVAKLSRQTEINTQNAPIHVEHDDGISINTVSKNDNESNMSHLKDDLKSVHTMTDREILIANHEILVKLLQKCHSNALKIGKLESKVGTIKQKSSVNEISLTMEDTVSLNKYFPVDISENRQKKIDRVEEMLQDKLLFKKLVYYLKGKGGNDYKKLIYNMMAAVLTNEVANNYSFTGRKTEKRAFSQLRLCSCIYQACKAAFSNVDDEDIKSSVTSWLDASNTRLKREQSGQKKGNNKFTPIPIGDDSDTE